MSLSHDPGCACTVCQATIARGIIAEDRERLAREWKKQRPEDGEVCRRIIAGHTAAPGSPIYIALCAISDARRGSAR